MCLKEAQHLEEIQTAYNNFMTCRVGGDLNEFDPVTINNVLSASCNGFNSSSGVEFDMPTIKAKFAEELRKEGFEVTEETTNGAASFGLHNNTDPKTSEVIATPAKKINMRVPGTPIARNEKYFVWD
jgi:hypothetical protein